MSRTMRSASLLSLLLILPVVATAMVEEKTGTEYADTIASYVAEGSELGEDKARTLRELKAPKRLRMDLRRSFKREKLIDTFRGRHREELR